MSIILISQAAYDQVKGRWEEENCKKAIAAFRQKTETSSLTHHPTGSRCVIPDDARLSVAKMQCEIRREFEEHFRLDGPGSYRAFLKVQKDDKQWAFKNTLPKPVAFDMKLNTVLSTVDSSVREFGLPEETREWYRALYQSMFGHTERLLACAKDFPDPRILYEKVTEKEPAGDIAVMYGPHAVHFRCTDAQDFARFYAIGKKGEEAEQLEQEAQGFRGLHLIQKLPESIGGYGSLSVENYPMTMAHDPFSTFEHEQEHAHNSFYRHASTYLDASEKPNETVMQECARLGMAYPVKEEIIPWSLRQEDFESLFLGESPLYDVIESKSHNLAEEQKMEAPFIHTFRTHAAWYLKKAVPTAGKAFRTLLQRVESKKILRELLRTVPLSDWLRVAMKLEERAR